MNKKYKIFIALIFLEILILMFVPKTYASSENCVLSVTPDKVQVKKEDKITIVLSVSNITAQNGIAIYNGIIDYNSDVFELSVQDSSNGAWKGELLENSVTFTKANLEATKDDQEIGRIVLKVKNGAQAGKQTIILKSNEFADETSFKVDDISTSIEIIGNNSNDNSGNNNNNGNNNNSNDSNNNGNNNSSNDTNNNGNNKSNDDNKSNNNVYNDNNNDINKNTTFVVEQENNEPAKSNTEEKDPIPYAGIIGTHFIMVILIIAIIIWIYAFNKYRQMKY